MARVVNRRVSVYDTYKADVATELLWRFLFLIAVEAELELRKVPLALREIC